MPLDDDVVRRVRLQRVHHHLDHALASRVQLGRARVEQEPVRQDDAHVALGAQDEHLWIRDGLVDRLDHLGEVVEMRPALLEASATGREVALRRRELFLERIDSVGPSPRASRGHTLRAERTASSAWAPPERRRYPVSMPKKPASAVDEAFDELYSIDRPRSSRGATRSPPSGRQRATMPARRQSRRR